MFTIFRIILFLPKLFMWCCFGIAALIFFPFTILTRGTR